MAKRKALVSIVGVVLAVLTIAVAVRAANAIVGIDGRSDRAIFVGIPAVLLITGCLFPLLDLLGAPSAANRARFRWALTWGVIAAVATSAISALLLVGLVTRIEHSGASFWAGLIVELAALLALSSVYGRVRPKPDGSAVTTPLDASGSDRDR